MIKADRSFWREDSLRRVELLWGTRGEIISPPCPTRVVVLDTRSGSRHAIRSDPM